MMRGQHAQAVGFDLERTIESRAHILERDGRSQVHDLLGVEVALELVEDLVGDVYRGKRHFFGVAERGALGGREQWVLGILCERREFFFADSKAAATGSVDVYSKDAADHLCGAQADHPLQRRRGDLGAFDRLHED